MTGPLILAIDQGTTNTKAALVDGTGKIVAQASSPLTSTYPRPGWAEQSASDIWKSVQSVIGALAPKPNARAIIGIAIANQRETLIVWDARTGQPLCPAILWQCRRSAAACAALHAEGKNSDVEAATGLSINPLFPASKLGWVMKNVPQASELAAKGNLRAGTVDSWLLWNLTGGTAFSTDHSNASRTQLFHTGKLSWDPNLCTLFGVPLSALATPLPSDTRFGETVEGATALPAGITILAMMGDSHAALYGHGVRAPGVVKATYGTGSSLMTLTPQRVTSRSGLSGTIAWSTQSEGVAYAIEGNITVSAQAAAFMATLLGLDNAAELSSLAQSVSDSNGVCFVPALAGLGAPHWNDDARGTVTGMTHSTQPAHLARAAFEAIALQIADVFAAMEQDIGVTLEGLKADGGASANDFLMQLQADVLDRPVTRGDVAEIGILGVSAMAFASAGLLINLKPSEGSRHVFLPEMDGKSRCALLDDWRLSLKRAMLMG